MFNNTYRTEINYDCPETIEIKNAPTSDQLRLLRETEVALRKEILGAVRVDDNKFKSAVFLRACDGGFSEEIVIRCTLNEKEFTITHRICQMALGNSIQDIFRTIVEKMSKEIAEHIILQTLIDNKDVRNMLDKRYNKGKYL